MANPKESNNLEVQFQTLDRVTLLVYGLVAVVLGTRPLADPDIGWHVAGGLWTLDHGAVPWGDPFGPLDRVWVSYSWLPGVVFALIYRNWGFVGLQAMQSMVIAFTAMLTVYAVQRVCKSQIQVRDRRAFLCELITVPAIFSLTAPIWHLRPQLISIWFFVFLVSWLSERKLTFWRVVPLAAVWANVHLYWAAVPLVVGCSFLSPEVWRDRAGFIRRVNLGLASFLAGLINPYGIELYRCMWEYGKVDRAARKLVTELQPLWIDHLYFLIVWSLIVLLALAAIRPMLRAKMLPELALFAAFAYQSSRQIKFLPLFAVAATPILFASLRELLKRCHRQEGVPTKSAPSSTFVKWGLPGSITLLLFAVASMFSVPSPLSPERADMLQAYRKLAEALPEENKRQIVLNHFDDGGWIILAMYDDWQRTQKKSIRVSIDGRMLVMGDERLIQFSKLRRSGEGGCGVAELWGTKYALVRKEAKDLRQIMVDSPCAQFWRVIGESHHWEVWARNGGES